MMYDDESANEDYEGDKYLSAGPFIGSFDLDIKPNVVRNYYFFNQFTGEVESIPVPINDSYDAVKAYPCWVNDIVKIDNLSNLSQGQFFVIKWENGDEGYLSTYQNRLFLTYLESDGQYEHLVYDETYGWLAATMTHPSYTTGLFDALSWCAETIGTGIGYGVWIGVNIYVGNIAGAIGGLEAVFAVDVAFATFEAAGLYVLSGDGRTAIKFFFDWLWLAQK